MACLADSMSMLSFFTLVSNELVSLASDLTWSVHACNWTEVRNDIEHAFMTKVFTGKVCRYSPMLLNKDSQSKWDVLHEGKRMNERKC